MGPIWRVRNGNIFFFYHGRRVESIRGKELRECPGRMHCSLDKTLSPESEHVAGKSACEGRSRIALSGLSTTLLPDVTASAQFKSLTLHPGTWQGDEAEKES